MLVGLVDDTVKILVQVRKRTQNGQRLYKRNGLTMSQCERGVPNTDILHAKCHTDKSHGRARSPAPGCRALKASATATTHAWHAGDKKVRAPIIYRPQLVGQSQI